MWKVTVSFIRKASAEPISGGSYNVSSPSDISYPTCFCKNLSTTAEVKLNYYQDPTLKGDFDYYCRGTVLHLQSKLAANQYLDVLRILVLPQILVPLTVSAKI